ncbi:MAG: hypothetical protein QOF85_425, partial [Solirubrobacterales bacterium]|nr:hypothetical protein [Solirubrobacterales bacterium]
LALVGRSVGDNWEHWRHNLGYLDYAVLAAIVGGVIYLLIKRRRKGSEPRVSGERPRPGTSAGR